MIYSNQKKRKEKNKMGTPIKNRYDFVYLFDVKDGNPNGDPDAGNQPRTDPETGNGLVTDVSLKRKVRNYIQIVQGNTQNFDIYIKEKAVLIEQHERAYTSINGDSSIKKDAKGNDKRTGGDQVREARAWMCQNFYDVRTFGAVMALKVNAGVVKGPIQFTFARSIDPVLNLEHSITRMAVATKQEAEAQGGDNRTMGRKHTISYGLYRAHGFISAHYANDTGFSEEDLNLFWNALQNMWDHDRSAARGEMACRGLYIFKHSGDENEAKLGTAPAHKLFDLVTVKRKDGVEIPRQVSDYEVLVNKELLKNQYPKIELIER